MQPTNSQRQQLSNLNLITGRRLILGTPTNFVGEQERKKLEGICGWRILPYGYSLNP